MNLVKYQNNMLKSATRVVLFIIVVTLCVLLLMTIKGDKFNPVFELFKTVVVSVISFFFGKSTQESFKPQMESSSPIIDKGNTYIFPDIEK